MSNTMRLSPSGGIELNKGLMKTTLLGWRKEARRRWLLREKQTAAKTSVERRVKARSFRSIGFAFGESLIRHNLEAHALHLKEWHKYIEVCRKNKRQ
jgi:hypothetical protein